MTRTIALLIVLIAGLALPANATEIQISKQAQSILERLKATSLSAWSKQTFSKQPAIGHAFDDDLDQLLQALDGQQRATLIAEQGETLDGTLAAIAAYRQAHPEFFREIYKAYTASGAHGTAALMPPPLKPEHAAARFRLVWEYVLLAPEPGPYSGLLDPALRALGQIGDPACVPALAQLFRSGLRGEREGLDDLDYRTDAVETLLRIPDQTALRALLQLTQEEADERSAPGAKRTAKNTAEKNLIYLFKNLPNEKSLAWKNVLASFSSARLSAAQQRYLKEFQTALNTVATP